MRNLSAGREEIVTKQCDHKLKLPCLMPLGVGVKHN